MNSTNPTPEKQFFLFRKKHPQAGFEPGTPTTNLEIIDALDRPTINPIVLKICE